MSSELSAADIAHFNATKVVRCADCGNQLLLRMGRFGLYYACSNFPTCRATHKAFPDGRPMGPPVPADIRNLRAKAYDLLGAKFEAKKGRTFLVKTLGVRYADAHVHKLSKRQLEIVIATLEGDWHKKVPQVRQEGFYG